jgi:hypothetical protein
MGAFVGLRDILGEVEGGDCSRFSLALFEGYPAQQSHSHLLIMAIDVRGG